MGRQEQVLLMKMQEGYRESTEGWAENECTDSHPWRAGGRNGQELMGSWAWSSHLKSQDLGDDSRRILTLRSTCVT